MFKSCSSVFDVYVLGLLRELYVYALGVLPVFGCLSLCICVRCVRVQMEPEKQSFGSLTEHTGQPS